MQIFFSFFLNFLKVLHQPHEWTLIHLGSSDNIKEVVHHLTPSYIDFPVICLTSLALAAPPLVADHTHLGPN